MDSPIEYPNFCWAPRRSQDYMKAIDNINEAYRKMLIISQAKKVFQNQVCPMMTAKTKEEFRKAQRNIDQKYWNYIKTTKATLSNFCVDAEFLPHPRKSRSQTPCQRLPTKRETVAKESILAF